MQSTRKLLSLTIAALCLSTSVSAASIDTFADDFSDASLPKWASVENGQIAPATVTNEKLTSSNYSFTTINPAKFGVAQHFEASMEVDSAGTIYNPTIVIGFKDENSPYYTVRLKIGAYGKPSIYRHTDLYNDLGGTQVAATSDIAFDASTPHKLSVTVKDMEASISVDGTPYLETLLDLPHVGGQVGIYDFSLSNATTADNFVVKNTEVFTENFADINGNGALRGYYKFTGDWTTGYRQLTALQAGDLILNDSFVADGDHEVALAWKNTSGYAENSPSIIFRYTDANSPYYTAVIEDGQYNRAKLYLHADQSDSAGTMVAEQDIYTSGTASDELAVRINGNKVNILLNGAKVLSYTDTNGLTGTRAGIRYQTVNQSIITESFRFTK